MDKYFRLTACLAVMYTLFGCVSFPDRKEESVTHVVPISTSTAPSITKTPPPTASVLDVGDAGLISQDPCGPPCFWGITPGVTRKEEVPRILVEKGILGNCAVVNDPSPVPILADYGWRCGSSFIIRYRLSDEKVKYIGLILTKPLALGDVVEKYGPPDFVIMMDTGLPEYPSFQLQIRYIDPNMTFPIGNEHEGFDYEITPKTVIDQVYYQDQQALQEDLERLEEDLLPWKGYGMYP